MLIIHIFNRILFIIACLYILISCANVRQPTGGPMDQQPPKVKATSHKNYKTNFKETELTIVFSEPIQANNLAKNFFISPKVEKQPKIKVKKRSIKIQLQDTLKANTTYTLTLLNAIQDITEKNTLPQYKYIFSTGSYIDSLNIEGKVIEPFSAKPLDNILVSLYPYIENDTNTVSNSSPTYFTYTNNQGKFEITNIKNGLYNLYAIRDENQNQQFNYGKELIDFEEKLQIDSSLSKFNLYPTKIDTIKPILRLPKSIIYAVEIETSEGLKSASVTELKSKKSIYSKLAENGKTLTIYNTEAYIDSTDIMVIALDSVNNKLQDTVKIKFLQPEQKDSLPIIEWSVTPSNFKVNKQNDAIRFTFFYPIKYPTKKIYTTPEEYLTVRNKKEKNYTQHYTLDITKRIKDTITLYLPDSMFISPFAESSKADTLYFTLQDETEFGSIEGKVETTEETYILQLLNSKMEILEERYNQPSFMFSNLKEGTYFLRIIGDINNNKQWDQAELHNGKKAESIYLVPDPIKVKENWEIKGLIIKY